MVAVRWQVARMEGVKTGGPKLAPKRLPPRDGAVGIGAA